MILDGDGAANIIQQDSLAEWSDIDLIINQTCKQTTQTYREYFDIVLTNPPFGTQGKIISDTQLKNFDLGHRWLPNGDGWIKTSELANGQTPEILFIERCLSFLKPGGKLAIVLPNGSFGCSTEIWAILGV